MVAIFAFVLLLVSVGAVDWVTCPPDQVNVNGYQAVYVRDCAYIQLPLNPDDLALGNVTAFVRRGYYSPNAPTGTALFTVAGGPGDSSRSMVALADYFIATDPSLTVYLFDERGTGLSSPITCSQQPVGAFNPYNSSQVASYAACNDEVMTKYGNITQYYGTYYGATDLLGIIQEINPETVSIYALSYGTYFTNTYLQLPGARADCVVLDGPVPPNRWPLENNAIWNSHVSQDLINLCVQDSSVCSSHLDIMGHTPNLVLDSIVDGTLPCLSKLSWLNATDGQHWTAVFTNYFTAADDRHALLGPFWYRLYRCSDSDVEQLNYFYNVQMQYAYTYSDPLDYSYGMAINIGASELYSFAGPKALDYNYQVQQTSRQFSDGSPELVVSYARNVSNFPLYTPNPSTYMKFAKPWMPVLILVGTIDPNTEYGLGPWFQSGLGANATLLTVPYSAHGTVNAEAICTDGIVSEFFASLGTSYDSSCLADLPAPDFDGSESATQQQSYYSFGTYDLWNDGFLTDNVTATDSCNPKDCEWSNDQVAGIIAGLSVSLGVVIVGLVAALHFVVARNPALAGQAAKNVEFGTAV